MGKVFRISLILVTMVLFSDSLSFGDQLEKGILPANFSQEVISGPWILHQKGELSFSSSERAESGNPLYGAKPIKALRNRVFSMNPEITDTMPSPVTTEVQKKELFHFENGQLSKGKSGYHFGKIHLTRNNLDPFINFISRLSVAKYEEKDTLSWASERYKEDDIFKSLAIFLELKFNF